MAGYTKNVCDGAFRHVKRSFRRTEVLHPGEMYDLNNNSSETSICVPSHNVEWKAWKRILDGFFNIPKDFKISNYHVFTFNRDHPSCAGAKTLTTTPNWDRFCLLKGSVSSYRVAIYIRRTKSERFLTFWPKLQEIKSAINENRLKYLKIQICERYFEEDMTFESKYFGDGKI